MKDDYIAGTSSDMAKPPKKSSKKKSHKPLIETMEEETIVASDGSTTSRRTRLDIETEEGSFHAEVEEERLAADLESEDEGDNEEGLFGFRHIRREGKRALVAGQTRMAEQADLIAKVLQSGSESLREADEVALGGYAQKLAEECDRLAGYLRNSEPRDVVDDLTDIAQRHPRAVFGGLFIAGLGLARFLKASAPGEALQSAEEDAEELAGFDEDGDLGDDEAHKARFFASSYSSSDETTIRQ